MKIDEFVSTMTQAVLAHRNVFRGLNQNMATFGYDDSQLGCGCKSCKFFTDNGYMAKVDNILDQIDAEKAKKAKNNDAG